MIKGIIQLLKDSGQLSKLVGDNSSNQKPKIYPVVAPQSETSPYITTHETGRFPVRCKEGINGYTFTANIVCYAKSYEQVDNLANAVQSAIENTSFVSSGGIDFKRLSYDTREDGFDNNAELYVKIVKISGMI